MSMPKGWEEVRLGDICDISSGGTPSKKVSEYWENGTIKWLGSTVCKNEKYINEITDYITESGLKNSSAKLYKSGTTLMALVGATIGKVAYLDFEATTNQNIAGLYPKDENVLNCEFLFYSVLMLYKYIFGQSNGNFNMANLSFVRDLTIKLPPLKEQVKIAEILSSCDEHIKNLKNLKSELEKEKLHLASELLSGKTRFSSFTTPWQEVTLKDLGEYRRGSFPQPYGNKEWYDGEGSMPFVQVFDVDDNFKLKPTTLKRISKLAQPKSIFIPKGSVIITIQGSIGRTAITQYDCYLDRTLLYFEKFLIPIDKKFFMYALFSVFEVEKLKAPGGTIKTITKEALSDFKIKLPSLEEQKKIGEVLSACDEHLQCLNELITAKTSLKSHLLSELLSGKLRVNA